MVRVLTIFKAERLLNIDLFLDWSIEEGTLHVHLIKLEAMVSSVGGLLRHRRSCKKKHLRKISTEITLKLPSRELRHNGMP
jgi:hypothetical protein